MVAVGTSGTRPLRRISRYGVLAPTGPLTHVAGPAADHPFPLGSPHVRLFAWARQAYFHALVASPLRPGDEVLVPAYHHGSEIEAVVAAGLTPRFYAMDERLGPDEDSLRALLGPRTRALHLTHLLGEPQDPVRWRRFCDEHGLLLVEDGAQALLARWEGRPVGTWGDIAFFCLYKTFGVPDGAALVAAFPVPEPAGRPPSGLSGSVKRQVAWAMQRSAAVAGAMPRRADGAFDPERDMALGDVAQAISFGTRRLLPGLEEAAATRRRRHHAWLTRALEGLATPLFPSLAPGASPFAFALVTDDAASVTALLRRRGIDATNFWSHRHRTLPEPDRFASSRLRGRVTLLPCHQELRERDLRAIATGAREVLT